MPRRVLLLAGMAAGPLLMAAGLAPQTSTLMSAEPVAERADVEKSPSPPIDSFGKPTGPAELKILKALRQPTELHLIEEPFQDALKYLSRRHKIEIVLDDVALEDVDIEDYEPITLQVSGISLRSGLDLMLRNLDLTWTIDFEVLLITTLDRAEMRTTTKTYEVGDLVVYRDYGGQLGEDYYHDLIDVIRSTIGRETWNDSSGGPGFIEGCTFGSAKVLVVRHLYQVHLEIARLLKAIRATPTESPGIAAGPAEIKILKALAEPTELRVVEEPLQGVIDYLADQHKIPIMLDICALNTFGVGKDEPITFDVSGISLRSALDLVLRELELNWTIDSEVLLITTPDEYYEREIVTVYNVTDLVTFRDEAGRPWVDCGDLAETIPATIARGCWGGMDWRNDVAIGTFGDAELFVIRQTWQVQLEIDQLLSTIREISKRHATDEQLPLLRRDALVPAEAFPGINNGEIDVPGGFGFFDIGSGVKIETGSRADPAPDATRSPTGAPD